MLNGKHLKVEHILNAKYVVSPPGIDSYAHESRSPGRIIRPRNRRLQKQHTFRSLLRAKDTSVGASDAQVARRPSLDSLLGRDRRVL